MSTPHDATAFSNPAQSSPAETAAQNAAVTAAAESSYQRSFDSTVRQYEKLTGTTPIPTIGEFDPATAASGAGTVAITVFGTNFTETSVVNWNGSAITTTFVSDSELTITPNKRGTAGNVAVYIDNGDGIVSATTQFTFS